MEERIALLERQVLALTDACVRQQEFIESASAWMDHVVSHLEKCHNTDELLFKYGRELRKRLDEMEKRLP